MWSPLLLEGEKYLIKKDVHNNVYKICLSDCIYIWFEELTSSKIYDRCKFLNPLMEGDEDNLVQWIISLLENEENIKIQKAENTHIMELNSKMGGISFIFKFYLSLASPEVLHKELTLPLLLIVHQLQEQKRNLSEMLKKKDMEISEYKMQGAQLIRKSIETPAFKEQEFEMHFNLESHFSNEVVKEPIKIFNQHTQDLFLNTMKKYECAKQRLQETALNVVENGIQSPSNDSSPEKREHVKIEEDYFTELMVVPPKKKCWKDQKEEINIKQEDMKSKESTSTAKLNAKKKQQKNKLPL